jgi:hypothetical protein
MEHRALKKWLLDQILKNSTLSEIPVLVIKKQSKLYLQICFASDFSEETKKPFKKWSNFPKCLMPICF